MLWTGRTLPPEDLLYAAAAAKHGLDLALVLAVVEHESSYFVGASNPEQRWCFYWDCKLWRPWRTPTPAELASETPPADFPSPPGVPRDAEWWLQAVSLGLMQVMGAVAREHGYTARCLGDLLGDPESALDLGCRHLKAKLARYPAADRKDAISAYNAGSSTWYKPNGNKDYVDAVLAAYARHRARLGGAA